MLSTYMQFNKTYHLFYVLIHSQGQATDIAIQAQEILKLKRIINEIYSEHTGQPTKKIGTSTISKPNPNTA